MMRTDPLDWNVVVTSFEREGGNLRRRLRPLARLRTTGFRNVFVARVDDPEAFLGAVDDLRIRDPRLERFLARIIEVEHAFPVREDELPESLKAEATRFLDRLGGKTFHVRLERRGHKGTLHAHQCELVVGEYLHAELARRELALKVVFDDPDVVVAIELLGDVGGIGLVTREMRHRFPFVRID